MSRSSELLAADRAARHQLRDAIDDLHLAQQAAGIRRPFSRLRWALLAVGVVIAIALAAWAIAGWMRSEDRYTDSDFEQAAAQRVSVLLSPNHREPAQARRILSGATGEFYDEFAQSADAYTAFVRANGTVTRASVDGTGVAGRTGDTASVLLAATIVFDPGPKAAVGQADVVRRFRLRVLVTPDDGVLKIGAVQYLP